MKKAVNRLYENHENLRADRRIADRNPFLPLFGCGSLSHTAHTSPSYLNFYQTLRGCNALRVRMQT